MAGLTLELQPVFSTPRPSRTATALKALMDAFEQGDGLDEPESETDLMIELSGMIGGEARLLEVD
jgi:hypothetical protein